jgi:hypothetical protein
LSGAGALRRWLIRNCVERELMVDRKGLGILGCILATVTAAVTAMALTVVLSHIDGSLTLGAMEAADIAALR